MIGVRKADRRRRWASNPPSGAVPHEVGHSRSSGSRRRRRVVCCPRTSETHLVASSETVRFSCEGVSKNRLIITAVVVEGWSPSGRGPRLRRVERVGIPSSSPAIATKATPYHRARHDRIDTTGKITLRHNSRLHHIGIGREHARTHVIVLVADLDIRIVNAATGELLRYLTLDPTRNYQPTGKPRSQKRQTPEPEGSRVPMS